jgi:hypothetical protein
VLTIPNVPNVPGVPPLSSFATGVVSLLVADAIALLGGLIVPSWGIFLNGIPVIEADSVVSLDYRQEWSISNYPVEKGAFESYDKVQTPFETRVRFASGGSQANRQALLDSIAAIAGDLNLYDVVTPEAIYQSVNVQRYSYDRAAARVGLMAVDVWVVQVRVSATQTFTQSASSSNAQATGQVQPQQPTTQQTTELLGAG